MKWMYTFVFITSCGLVFANHGAAAAHPVKPNKSKENITIQTQSGVLKLTATCTDQKTFINVQSQLNITQEMRLEAHQRQIFHDEAVIVLKRDEACNITHFSVLKSGKLNSFNQLAKQFCAELIKETDWQLIPSQTCQSNCERIVIPFRLDL